VYALPGLGSQTGNQPRLRGLPPPTPPPGLDAFQASIVAGFHPLTAPITASGSGSLYRPKVSGLTPSRSATSVRDRR
jgi:hypothetical protein